MTKQTTQKKTTQETYDQQMTDREAATKLAMTEIMKAFEDEYEIDSKTKAKLKKKFEKITTKLVKTVAPKLKIPKQEHKPKAVPSGFIIFSTDTRSKVAAENPEMKATEVTKELGRQWKALSEDKKSKYEKKRSKLKKKYEDDMAAWKENYPDEAATESESKARSSSSSSSKSSEPKRAPTAYQLFLKDSKGLSKEEKSEKWKKMKESQSSKWKKYTAEALKLKNSFKPATTSDEDDDDSKSEEKTSEELAAIYINGVVIEVTEKLNKEEIEIPDVDIEEAVRDIVFESYDENDFPKKMSKKEFKLHINTAVENIKNHIN